MKRLILDLKQGELQLFWGFVLDARVVEREIEQARNGTLLVEDGNVASLVAKAENLRAKAAVLLVLTRCRKERHSRAYKRAYESLEAIVRNRDTMQTLSKGKSEWTDYRSKSYWASVFKTKRTTLNSRIKKGEYHPERKPGTWLYRFPISELPVVK